MVEVGSLRVHDAFQCKPTHSTWASRPIARENTMQEVEASGRASETRNTVGIGKRLFRRLGVLSWTVGRPVQPATE